MYKPPFSITNNMLLKTISITEKLSKINSYDSLNRMPILRRNNRIKSIHSSLSIEANSLSLDQVKDVINGKMVIGPINDVLEVKNAYEAYENINKFDGYKEKDLLKAHYLLTNNIEKDAGKYRNHPEDITNGKKVIFVAPPENMVPSLMKDLFKWLKNDKDTHILLKSCVFHYEFVFIHPFSDGNGRTVRLWQNILLMKWNPLFEFIPIESQIKKYQKQYYDAINRCHKDGNSNIFIEFMLDMIDKVLDDVLISISKESRCISNQVNRLLEVMEYDMQYSANELMNLLNIKSKETLRNSYLNPAITNGLIKMTIPEKPNSKNQKYIKL